jgi:spoIIIJ-associated protein
MLPMEPKQSVEATGEDVEMAVAAGLAELGVGPSDVLVEVLDEPSKGVFGIGAKPARVRLQLLRPPEPASQTAPPSPQPVSAARVETYEDYAEDEETDDEIADYIASEPVSEDDLDEDGRVGREVLLELLERMEVEGDVIVRRSEPGRSGERAPWILDVDGGDMRLLIGRRGETLNSLQYITRLIVSRRLQRRANIIVDAGGYKSRRSERLYQLARRMAEQAVQQGRAVTLEPMPPNERRIIHLALRDRDDVETRSTGEGSSRKVSIVPK